MTDRASAPLTAEDWTLLRDSLARRLRFHLRTASVEEIEDHVQDALLRVVRFIARAGMPDSLDALASVIARRTAISAIRRRYVRGTPASLDDFATLLADERALDWLRELEDEVAVLAMRVLQFFEASDARCLEPAMARARGEDLKHVGAETDQSHAALRKRWSRCMERLKQAIARGEPGLRGLPGWGGEPS